MKIISIELNKIVIDDFNYTQKPLPSYTKNGIFLIIIYTDEGLYGAGEPSPYSSNFENLTNSLNNKGPKLIGKDPLDSTLINTIFDPISNQEKGYGKLNEEGIKAGISQALLDLKGKILKKPAYKIKSTFGKKHISVYGSAGMVFDQPKMEKIYLKEALNIKELGINYFKLRPPTSLNSGDHFQRNKFPPKVNLEEFAKIIKLIGKEMGSNFKILIDFGCRLNYEETINFSKKIETENILFFEEPLIRDHLQYKSLRNEIDIQIAGGESLSTYNNFKSWQESLDIFQPDINICGFEELERIDLFAKNINKKLILHNWANTLSVAANATFASYSKQCNMIEYNLTFNPFTNIIFEEGPKLKNGFLELSDLDGLGVTINFKELNKYAVMKIKIN